MKSNLAFLHEAESRNKWDPPSLFKHVNQAVKEMVSGYLQKFGSVGKAP
jgi:fructose-bisphosphate aldolase class II